MSTDNTNTDTLKLKPLTTLHLLALRTAGVGRLAGSRTTLVALEQRGLAFAAGTTRGKNARYFLTVAGRQRAAKAADVQSTRSRASRDPDLMRDAWWCEGCGRWIAKDRVRRPSACPHCFGGRTLIRHA